MNDNGNTLQALLVIVVLSVSALVLVGTLANAEEHPVFVYQGGPVYLIASEPILSVTPAHQYIEGTAYFPDAIQEVIRFWHVPGGEQIRWAAPAPLAVRERRVRHFVVIVRSGAFRDLAGNVNDEPATAHIIVNASAPVGSLKVVETSGE